MEQAPGVPSFVRKLADSVGTILFLIGAVGLMVGHADASSGLRTGTRSVDDATREIYRKWLDNQFPPLQQYHNHKETMAWAVTSIFFGGAAAFLASPLPGKLDPWLGTYVIALTAFALLIFVRMQFRMRWVAGSVTNAMSVAYLRLADSDLSYDDLQLVQVPDCWDLPKFVADLVKKEAPRSFREARRGGQAQKWRTDLRWHSEVPTSSSSLLLLSPP